MKERRFEGEKREREEEKKGREVHFYFLSEWRGDPRRNQAHHQSSWKACRDDFRSGSASKAYFLQARMRFRKLRGAARHEFRCIRIDVPGYIVEYSIQGIDKYRS